MNKAIKYIKSKLFKQVEPNINGIPLWLIKEIEEQEKKQQESKQFRWANGRERFNSPHYQ